MNATNYLTTLKFFVFLFHCMSDEITSLSLQVFGTVATIMQKNVTSPLTF